MALPEFTKKLIQKTLSDYCTRKVPSHVKDQYQLDFKFRGNSVTLYEERPTFMDKSEWVDIVVAQFRYDPKTQKWSLYCADRNSKWHEYIGLNRTKDFNVLLEEVEADPTGIFWG